VADATPDAIAAVRSFLAAYSEIRAVLFDELGGIGGIAELIHAVRSRRTLDRQGSTASGITYLVHGAGCLMTDQRGREVDVDLLRDPATGAMVEAIDAWRIRGFLTSCDAPAIPSDDLDAACHQLSGQSSLRVLNGTEWFALDGVARAT
jgi:hypothetical protein